MLQGCGAAVAVSKGGQKQYVLLLLEQEFTCKTYGV